MLVKALLFGDGSYDDKVFLSLRSAGLLVLMNLSGLLINSLFYNLKRILSIKFNKKKSELIAFILILPLLILNLDSPSIIRIYLYRSICLFLVLKDKKIDYLSVKSIPFLCLIFCDRFLINSFSIILPLVVSFGIYFANTLINSKILFVKKVYFHLILTLFILPFNIYFNKCFNVANILITSALIPINAIIVALLMPSILGMKLPFSGLILNADYKFLELCNFKYLNINGPQMNQYVITIYYVVLMCLIYFMEARNRYIYKKILMGFVISLCFYFIPINNFIYMSVNFINVGQGDSTLITYRGQNILIDTGGSLKEDIATNYLIPFFRKNKIYKIDYVFITHYDMDHYYALDSLKKNFIVGNIYDYNNFKDMKIGNLSIYNKNINMQESVEENDKSLVLNFIINDISLLLMGDAPKSVEYEIMRKWPEMTVDYLKCGHHGSNTSTSYEFISWLHPKEAIISCGENNKYGHPHKEVIDCLKQENVIIRRTDEEGTIKYRFFV